jgi:hypothetical protein
MALYELAEAAEEDLKASLSTSYPSGELNRRRVTQLSWMPISRRSEMEKPGRASSFNTGPELRVSRIEHHYIFHLKREKQCPIISQCFTRAWIS